MSSRKIEMVWRCNACDTENLGRNKVCQSCGDPKDASEKFVFPGPASGGGPQDTKSFATVTDPELLKKATAGKDWRCEACGANQSALSAKCTQCGAANAAAPKAAPVRPIAVPSGGSAVLWDPVPGLFALAMGAPLVFGTVVVGGLGLLVGAVWFVAGPRGPVDVPVTVAEHRWHRSVAVERLALRDFDGFVEARPTDALEIRSLGDKHHHDEQVLDHYRTESYTEQVADGYDTRSYTEQVACGEDCTYEAPTCSETCTADDNGFATCTESCWGGGNSCTTRYCTEYKTEQVQRYRTEHRTREVPEYRSEPRYAEAFAWRAWRWERERELVRDGSGLDAAWPPDDEVHLDVGLAEGEDERATQAERYGVSFTGTLDDSPRTWRLDDVPEVIWRSYVPGSAHVARVASDGTLITLDPPAKP